MLLACGDSLGAGHWLLAVYAASQDLGAVTFGLCLWWPLARLAQASCSIGQSTTLRRLLKLPSGFKFEIQHTVVLSKVFALIPCAVGEN